MQEIKTIDDVITVLDSIILESEKDGNPLGYFAALYQKVTVKVKEGIESNYFDDGPRMEKLDVVFAKKYIEAYFAWKRNNTIAHSWEKAFSFSNKHWPIVLQHLLMGMNAHINLDLGIAAAEIAKNKQINDLKDDFFRINEILASLVNDVQKNLSTIWPTLKKILAKTGKIDNLLVDFSMELARDGAWEFAQSIALLETEELKKEITIRDKKIAGVSKIISQPKWWIRIILWFIRIGETGSVARKIRTLKAIKTG